jgi:hypothetical protein
MVIEGCFFFLKKVIINPIPILNLNHKLERLMCDGYFFPCWKIGVVVTLGLLEV